MTQTITAMYQTRAEAEQVADSVRRNTTFAGATARVLPETDAETTATTEHQHDTGFIATLRNFFMPEEDRYGYAEGMRRGSYMVAIETDASHAHEVMDLLEHSGAVDLDAQEAEWRREGWHGYEPAGSTTAGITDSPAAYGAMETSPAAYGATDTRLGAGVAPATTVTTMRQTDMPAEVGHSGLTGTDSIHDSSREVAHAAPYAATAASETEERIQLAEETLRVGKRQVVEGRVRLRSYVVETPVSETVRLRDEHVHVERQPVDRPITAGADPFRERIIEATESREEAVVSKDARIREELVMRRSVNERDETVQDTVRHTEVEEDRGDAVVREPGTTRTP